MQNHTEKICVHDYLGPHVEDDHVTTIIPRLVG